MSRKPAPPEPTKTPEIPEGWQPAYPPYRYPDRDITVVVTKAGHRVPVEASGFQRGDRVLAYGTIAGTIASLQWYYPVDGGEQVMAFVERDGVPPPWRDREGKEHHPRKWPHQVQCPVDQLVRSTQ